MNKYGIKLSIITALLLAAGTASAFASTASTVTFKDSSAGKLAYRTGIPQLVKMPFKIFVKAGESMDSGSGSGYLSSEGVVVGEPYNLDAETTG